MGHMLGEAEEAEHYPHQTDGPDLDITPGGEAHPEASCPLVLARPEVGGQILRLRLDLLKSEEQQVWPRVITEEAAEVIATGELCSNIPSYHLENKDETIREKIPILYVPPEVHWAGTEDCNIDNIYIAFN